MRAIEQEFLQRGERILVPRIRRGGVIEEAAPETVIREGDLLAVAGRRPYVIAAQSAIGTEVDDKALLDVPVDGVDVVVTEKPAAGAAIGQFIEEVGPDFLRGVGVRRIAARAPSCRSRSDPARHGNVVTLVGFPGRRQSAWLRHRVADRAPTSPRWAGRRHRLRAAA